MYYSGIDVHKKYFISAVVDDRGQLLHKKRVSTDRPAIRKYLEELKTLGPVKAVMEAGFNWSYLYDGLAEELEVVLANPMKTRLIAEARIKLVLSETKGRMNWMLRVWPIYSGQTW